jgi:hypothetical protein
MIAVLENKDADGVTVPEVRSYGRSLADRTTVGRLPATDYRKAQRLPAEA